MSRIQQLPLDTTITGGDKLVGTDVGSNNATKSFQIETIAAFFAQTGAADPLRAGLQYNYAGKYVNNTIASGEFRYQVDPTAPSAFGWAHITGIAVSRYNRNLVDINPIIGLFVNQLVRVTDIDTSSNTSYAIYEVSAKSDLTNAYLLSLEHRGSAGDPVGGITSIAPSGFTNETTFTFTQGSASNTWTINHNLDRFPSVTVVDSSDNIVVGAVTYNNSNQIVITFTETVIGKAYLN